MSLKVANYNSLRQDVETLRAKYRRLEKESKQTGQQLASLQVLANEVSVAYGIKRQLEGPSEISMEGRLVPTMSESLEEYDFLKAANLSRYSRRTPLFQSGTLPSIWPVNGVFRSYFGRRSDPFSGEGAFHPGVDISATSGTPVKVAGDGVVTHAAYSGQYGKLVIVDHGNGIQTYYAHLSQFLVVVGQSIHRGEVLALSGGTGRATSPHLHYEVRKGGIAINPQPYLNHNGPLAQAAVSPRELPF